VRLISSNSLNYAIRTVTLHIQSFSLFGSYESELRHMMVRYIDTLVSLIIQLMTQCNEVQLPPKIQRGRGNNLIAFKVAVYEDVKRTW